MPPQLPDKIPLLDTEAKKETSSVLPKTENYMESRGCTFQYTACCAQPRRRRLHFRHFVGDVADICSKKAVVFYFHGYNGHINRPETRRLGERLNRAGKVMFCMDMRGHGYSDGMRALMPSLDETLADMEDFISYIMTGAKYTSAHCDLDNKVVEVIRELPFFIMASSGGAAFSTLLSIRMNEDVNFKGMVMLAPALSVDIPHWVLVIVLRYSIAYLAPEQDMPKCISNATDESLNYKDANVSAKMLEFEDTLSYTGKMRWATAMMFVDVMQRFNAQVSMVRKPFTIFHDPGDGICNISGSRQLLNESSTVWNRKSIVELPGEKHALLVNCTDRISELSSDWMDKQLKLW